MKRIVILSQPGQVNLEFIAMLKAVFPECDIRIAAADGQDFEACPPGSFSKTDRSPQSSQNAEKEELKCSLTGQAQTGRHSQISLW